MTGSWQQTLGGDDFSLRDAVGGVRGVLEALLPGLVFVVTYVSTFSLGWTIGLSAGMSVLFVIVRLVQRSSPTQAIAGLLGVAIGVVWALTTGRAENYYAWGLLVNVAYGAVLLLSVLIRQPLAAWAVQFLWSLPAGWMRDPQYRVLYRRTVAVTWAWVAVFAIRLLITAPLYFGEAIVALGIAKLVLGLPLFALAAWLTWILLRNMRPENQALPTEQQGESED